MPPSQIASRETAPSAGLGWARRVVRQQLDALSRLTAAARRLVDQASPRPGAIPAIGVSAGILVLEKALRLHSRVGWALRLIEALRAKLVADLQALDDGQAPAPPVEARSFAANAELSMAVEMGGLFAERAERPERERPDRLPGLMIRDDFTEILKRPTAEVIALICRELGLPDDWPTRAEEAFDREEAAMAFSSPARGGGAPRSGGGGATPQALPTPALSSS